MPNGTKRCKTGMCIPMVARSGWIKQLSSGPKEVEELGAGEIFLTSMDADGEKSGYEHSTDQTGGGSVSIYR